MSHVSSKTKTAWLCLLLGVVAAAVAIAVLRVPRLDEAEVPTTAIETEPTDSSNDRKANSIATDASADTKQYQRVVELIARRDISRALRELQTLESSGSDAAGIALLRAECYSHLRMQPQVEANLSAARQARVAVGLLKKTELLTSARAGKLAQSPRDTIRDLIQSGVDESDACSAAIIGAVSISEDTAAQLIAENPSLSEAERAYLRGSVALGRSDYKTAETELRRATELSPQHELAHSLLVELSESPVGSLEMAMTELQRMQQRFPDNPFTPLRLVRVLRNVGEGKQARDLLAAANNAELHSLWLIEKAELDFDQGQYRDALSTLAELGLNTPASFGQLADQAFMAMTQQQGAVGEPLFRRLNLGAITLVFSGQAKAGQRVFEDYLDRVGRLRRMIDLNRRQSALGPSAGIQDELVKLANVNSSSQSTSGTKPIIIGSSDAAVADSEQLARGSELYADLCLHCHGERGDGQGRAARHLFPLPRNLLQHRLHFVTGQSGLALDADIARTIREGLHGTSMPAYRDLNESDITALVKVVRAFQWTGARDRAIARGLSNEERDQTIARAIGKDAQPITIPAVAVASDEVVARGRVLFEQAGCVQCHRSRPDKTSLARPVTARTLVLFDEAGEPTVAPDLATHVFKGGDSIEAIYARLAVGMPGTPHPALADEPEQLLTLSYYVRSMLDEGRSALSNQQRRQSVVITEE